MAKTVNIGRISITKVDKEYCIQAFNEMGELIDTQKCIDNIDMNEHFKWYQDTFKF